MPFANPNTGVSNPVPRAAETIPLTFTGSAGEYFSIWLANVLLTLVTLGLYSPWAKVRRERYLLGHTWVRDANFEYTADPIKIFKGRLIVGAAFILFTVLNSVAPALSIILPLIMLPFLPWLIVSSLRFRCRYTRFRGIHFQFNGTSAQAFMPMLGWKFLGAISFGLLYPLAKFKARQFVVNNAAFGRTPFRFQGKLGDFYSGYGLALITALAAATLAVIAAALKMRSLSVIVLILLYPLALGLFACLSGYIAKLSWNGAKLGDLTVECDIAWGRYLYITLTNFFAIILSLGLATPWAMIRAYRYRAEHFAVTGTQDMNTFIAAEQQNLGSLADQASDLYDLDLEFGF